MVSKSRFIIVSIAVSLMASGCGWWNTAYRNFNVDDGSGAMVDIKQRAVIVSKEPVSKRTIVCAEPSPDSMSAYASEVAGKVNAYGKVDAELTGAFQESAAYTGLRTQSIQLLRDGLYRLCEGYMSGALDKAKYDTLMRRYQKHMVALLAIEQLTGAVRVPPVVINTEGRAETTASISKMRKEAEEIELEIGKREKQTKDIKDEIIKIGDTNPEKKKDLEQQVTNLEQQIGTRKKDLDRINKAIENARGSIASGSATATVSMPTNLNERSDAHIQAVATTVKEIVVKILETEDAGQLCWAYLTYRDDDGKVAPDKEVKDACLAHIKNGGRMEIHSE